MNGLLERWPAESFGRELDRWKRLQRQGWSLTVLQEIATGDVIVMGWRNLGAFVLEPDPAGQFELPLEV